MCKNKDIEHELVEQIFQETHYRDEQGRFVVEIPMNPNVEELGSSRAIALKRFFMLERKFEKDEAFKQQYVEFMREYESLGHMRLATEEPLPDEPVYYIPHHGVISSGKFRVVFDGSCKTDKGISLNDAQMIGEKLQRNLFEHIMRFRRHRIGIIADIKKMYRMVKIVPKQWNVQRIFWRENKYEPIKEYQLIVVTYGLASSAHCAVRAMNEGAKTFREKYPEAVQSIENNFYMDDGMFGAETTSKAIKLAKEIKYVLSTAGFELCKWRSNDNELLEALAGVAGQSVSLSNEEHTFVLGLKWLTHSDEFAYEVKQEEISGNLTKRNILGKIAQFHDPNGYIEPVIASAKCLIQNLWKAKLDWDTPVSIEWSNEWKEIWNLIHYLEQIRIPRWLGIHRNVQIQLHGFADASNRAYGAVIYLRMVDLDGIINTNLLFSKSKVAPIKKVTIPRLELAAAELLSKLYVSVSQAMELQNVPYFLWSDSSITLQWMNKELCDLKLFVANRVKTIKKNTSIQNWFHVRTKENPADLVSRGLRANEIVQNSLWWHGPSWLSKSQEDWPEPMQINQLKPLKGMLTELKVHSAFKEDSALSIFVKNHKEPVKILNYSNNLCKLQRIISYVIRIEICKRKNRAKPKKAIKSENISNVIKASLILPSEIEKSSALRYFIKMEQSRAYSRESNYFKERKNNPQAGIKYPENSKLNSLSPYMDENELIRAKGRLSSAYCSEDTKHPVIIPNDSRLSELLIIQAHSETNHGHVQQIMQYIRTNFWISKLRSESRRHVHKCIVCARYNKGFEEQLMASLPADRMRRNRAFLITGVDYCGPIEITERYKSRSNTRKCWIAIFVCMVTRAVHIDIIADLSAAEFIACFERFINRRGHCNKLYSDNGTSFVGAYKEIKIAYKNWDVPEVHEHLNKRRTEWIFMKPAAPHQGGIYEAAVKSAKFHLKRIIGARKYTYGNLMTLLIQIEAILNSRPMYALSDDPNDMQALRPGHFIIGESFIVPPPIEVPNQTNNSIKRIREEQRAMLENFWKRWENEYLTTLLQRKKWTKEKEHFRLGQLALIADENLAPAR